VIHPATEADYEAYARLATELRVDDAPVPRSQFTAELLPRMIVVAVGDQVVGYALADQLADTGYVRNVVTDPAARRRGHGSALMAALRAAFVAAGATSWRLNVKPDNAAAIALYRKHGMREAYRAYTLRVPSSIPLVPAPGVELAPLTAEDDAALEASFELQRGQLVYARARASRRLVKLVRDGKVAGIGVFVASVPGSFPFRLTEPALAATFVAHLRPLAAPDATFVQVVVEDDPPLRDAVLALGGYVHHEIAHMHGAL